LASLDAFLDMMAAERGASRNTLEAYRRDLLAFDAHLARKGHLSETATRDEVRGWLASMAATAAASSQARRLSALRQYFAFLYAEGLRRDDPTASVDAPQYRRSKILNGWDMFKCTLAFEMFFKPLNVEALKDVSYNFDPRNQLLQGAVTEFKRELAETAKKLLDQGLSESHFPRLDQLASSIQY